MSPSQWGPPTWIFLHTLAEKIKDSSFPSLSKALITNIYQICSNLPCPECASHAKHFWSRVNLSTIKTKTDLVNVLFVFHNSVNMRKKYKPFNYEDLKYYKTRNVIETYNNFAKNFNTNGNMNLIAEAFHRNRLLVFLKKWLLLNIKHFDM
jgi:hypothetical protein